MVSRSVCFSSVAPGGDVSCWLCVSVGTELLYRTREGDVVKFDMETNDSTVLVPNRKFVSPSSCICDNFILTQ